MYVNMRVNMFIHSSKNLHNTIYMSTYMLLDANLDFVRNPGLLFPKHKLERMAWVVVKASGSCAILGSNIRCPAQVVSSAVIRRTGPPFL